MSLSRQLKVFININLNQHSILLLNVRMRYAVYANIESIKFGIKTYLNG